MPIEAVNMKENTGKVGGINKILDYRQISIDFYFNHSMLTLETVF
jgi:hypothetical protein